MKIHVQHLSTESVVLNFLYQGQPLGAGIVLDFEIHQQVFGYRMMDEGFHFLGVHLEFLRLDLTAIDDRGDTA